MDPLVMVAPTGARRNKADHAAVPLTLKETLATAAACHQAGAGALHLHIRDRAGAHSLDPGAYREALAELDRALPAMAVQVTTESAGIYDVADQLRVIREVRPQAASISVREIARDPDLAPRIYGEAEATGTRVQHILYDADDAARLADWQARGIVRPGQTDQIRVLGRYADGVAATPEDLDAFPAPEPGIRWMVCAFGPREHDCLIRAAGRGADLRVGFENSLTDAAGHAWRDNADSVRALLARIRTLPVASDGNHATLGAD